MGAPEEWPATSIRFVSTVRPSPLHVGSTVRPGPARALRPDLESRTIVVAIGGAIERADVPGLSDRLRTLLEGSDADAVVCDVSALVDPDAAAVDALARLQLTAGRLGRRLLLIDACDDLRELLALVGLADVVPPYGELPLEVKGETKKREEGRGVEEEADAGNPPA